MLSHAWAAATCTPVLIRTHGVPDLRVQVAEAGPLVAMKLRSIMNRGAAKEGTDLLDIIRLTLDQTVGPDVRRQLAGAHAQLRQDAILHAQLWFADRSDRALRLIRAGPEGRDVQLDDLHLVGELLQGALSSS